MKIKVMRRSEWLRIPTKAHEEDAGFDIYSPRHFTIEPRGSIFIDTGIHFEIPRGYVGMIKSKSGLNAKLGLLTEGVIDSGYTGPVGLKIYNNSDDEISINKNQKLTQIVFLPIPEVKLVEVDELEESERGEGGFGSTGL